MKSITSELSLSLIFVPSKESRNDGPGLSHYNGLKSVKAIQLGSSGFDNKGPFPVSAKCGKITSSTVLASKRETDPKKRIVVTGMGLVSVFGSDIDTYYNNLLDGVSGVTLIDRFDTSECPVKIAGQIRNFSSEGYVDGKNGLQLDDCWKYGLVGGKRALNDAGLGKQVLQTMDKTRMGVLVGSAVGSMATFSNAAETLLQKGYKKISPLVAPYILPSMGSTLLAIDIGLKGPTYAIGSACASANHCFIAAANHIRRGETDVMVAGGTEAAITPLGVGCLMACRALSKRNDEPHKASRPWNKSRDGFIIAEGAGILIMESLEHAMRRGAKIYVEYLGGAVTIDAHHITDPHPDGTGVSSCITKCLENAGVAPEEVNYVNAHATSTIVGDLAEVKGIKRAFKNTFEIKMNATKSMIGHALGATGGLDAIATIKAINTGWLHPTINQYDLDPEVTIDTIPDVKKQHEVHVAISNSFGFGGHNAVVAFAPFKP